MMIAVEVVRKDLCKARSQDIIIAYYHLHNVMITANSQYVLIFLSDLV